MRSQKHNLIYSLILVSILSACGGSGGSSGGGSSPTPSPTPANAQVITVPSAIQLDTPISLGVKSFFNKDGTRKNSLSQASLKDTKSCFALQDMGNGKNYTLTYTSGQWNSNFALSYALKNVCPDSTKPTDSPGQSMNIKVIAKGLKINNNSISGVGAQYNNTSQLGSPYATVVVNTDADNLLIGITSPACNENPWCGWANVPYNATQQFSVQYQLGGPINTATLDSLTLDGDTPPPPPPSDKGSILLNLDGERLSSVCSTSTACDITVTLYNQGLLVPQEIHYNPFKDKTMSYEFTNLNPGVYNFTVKNMPHDTTAQITPASVSVTGDKVPAKITFIYNQPATIGNINVILNKIQNPDDYNTLKGITGISVSLVDETNLQSYTQLMNMDGSYVFTSKNANDKYHITVQGIGDPLSGIYYNIPNTPTFELKAGQTIDKQLNYNPVESNKLFAAKFTVTGLDSKAVTPSVNFTGNTINNFKYLSDTLQNGSYTFVENEAVAINPSSVSGYSTPVVTPAVIDKSGTDVNVTYNPITPHPSGFIYSPYKDVGTNLNWNTGVISTLVNVPALSPLIGHLPNSVSAITWAFATGACGSENWAGMTPVAIVAGNVQAFVDAKIGYIISTGGEAGKFTCSTNQGMLEFINTFMSPYMLGIDFDIEVGLTDEELNSLISTLVNAQSVHPALRISFTLPTLADSTDTQVSIVDAGQKVLNTADRLGLKNYIVNLMTMDYGKAIPTNCVVVDNKCDMSASAIQAAKNLHNKWNIPYSRIELTPMIGVNDTSDEIFYPDDATKLAQWVVTNKLAGLHYWAYDHDTPGSPMSATCSGLNFPPLTFANSFYNGLHGNE